MSEATTFLYRLPRFAISFPFPVVFTTAEHRLTADCLNLSETGLLAEFSQPVAAQLEGTAEMHPGSQRLEIPAVIIHSEGFRAGLLFRFANADQERTVRSLVQAISHVAATGIRPS